MRTAASAVADAGVDAWASERLGAARAARLRALAADPGVPPFFGRTDGGTSDSGVESFHIGRRHVRDAAGDSASEFLRAEIERPRSGPMRDIVATIQPDQDDIVRAPLGESICVQGAPGTGKTAVGLHRAAYLLYTHSGQLARTGVLVVGP